MLSLLIIFCVLLSPSIYFYLKYNKKFEEILPLTIFSIILIIYILGLFNQLKLGVYIVVILAIILYILSIINVIKNKKNLIKIIKNFLTPGFVLWCFAFLTLCLFYRGRMIIKWDEFTHWGDVVKMMYQNNFFSTNPNSLSAARAYLPSMSIFQYFFQVLSVDGFKESFLFISYQLFGISLFLPFFKNIK